MEEPLKQRISGLIVFVLLSSLIVIRMFSDSEENTWISFLNFIGLPTAFCSAYFEIHAKCANYKKFNILTGCFAIILIALIVIAALILSGVIDLSNKVDDIILLLTLLISLPVHFYTSIILRLIKD